MRRRGEGERVRVMGEVCAHVSVLPQGALETISHVRSG